MSSDAKKLLGYLSKSELWKEFLEKTKLSPEEALRLAQDDGSYVGGEPHIYAPTYLKVEYKARITYENETLRFSITLWPYRMEEILVVRYESKEEKVPITWI